MTDIRVVPLGAGQDVGRSCILLSIGGKNIMFDCGMHMGYNDARRFPDFNYITRRGGLTRHIDAVIITHFHLDHCGALPYMSEMVGYEGPIYMTHPTKAICPILLEDYRKITVERKGETNFFTSEMIKNCMKKVVIVGLHETIKVDDDLEIKAYYAGHVLGAAMYLVKVGQQSVVYTGDYNMTPDRHLGAAWIDRCTPDLLITESTYAATVRDSKRCREGDFLKKVHDCVEKGGKVLIPVFALGRAQELCILLETYWERMNLKVPIYFTMGLTGRANEYYKLFISWTNEKIKNTFVQRNMFEFNHISAFDHSYTDLPGGMVVFATPGMLHGGNSLQIFKKWCGNENNMIIMPGYCVAGTIGNKVLSGKKKIELDNKQMIEVKLKVEHLSFSAHADAKGITQLIRMAKPRNVMLVHGEKVKMSFLAEKIQKQFGVKCVYPANGETSIITTNHDLELDVSRKLIKDTERKDKDTKTIKQARLMQGVLVIENEKMELLDTEEALDRLGMKAHNLRFTVKILLKEDPTIITGECFEKTIVGIIFEKCKSIFSLPVERKEENAILIGESINVSVCECPNDCRSIADKEVIIVWNIKEELVGCDIVNTIKYNINGLKKVKRIISN